MRENRLAQRAPQHCCRRAGAEVRWTESFEGCLFVSQSSYGGDLSPPNRCFSAPPPPGLRANPHMAGVGHAGSSVPRISDTQSVSQSSHNGGRARQNRRHRPLHHPVCEQILTHRYVAIATTGDAVSSDTQFVSKSSHNGIDFTETGDAPPLHRPVCEPILTRWGSDTPESAPPRISDTRFVSQSSHNGGLPRQNR